MALMSRVEGNRRIVGYMKTESCIDKGTIQNRHEVGLLGLGGDEEELIKGRRRMNSWQTAYWREKNIWKGLMIQSRKCYMNWDEFTSISVFILKSLER